jgi:hypothetical protein
MKSIIFTLAFGSIAALADVASGNAATGSTGTTGNTNNYATSVYNGGGCSGVRINSGLFLMLGLGAGLWFWALKKRAKQPNA